MLCWLGALMDYTPSHPIHVSGFYTTSAIGGHPVRLGRRGIRRKRVRHLYFTWYLLITKYNTGLQCSIQDWFSAENTLSPSL